jgi:DNA polymerase-3 subunit beta
LTCVRLTADHGHVAVAGTDLDVRVEATTGADVLERGIVVLDAARLGGTLIDLTGIVTLASEDTMSTTVQCGRSRFKLPTLSPDDFPVFTPLGPNATWTLTAADVHALFTVGGSAVSAEKTRYYLCGINLANDDGQLAATSTDGHRLVHVKSAAIFGTSNRNIIVPSSACRTIAKTFAKTGATICTDGVKLTAASNGTTVSTKLIDAKYPSWERTVTPPSPIGAAVAVKDITAAVDRLAAAGRQPVVRGDKNPPPAAGIRVAWDAAKAADEIVLTLGKSDAEAHDYVGASDVTDAGVIGLNPSYLTSMCAAMGGERVRLSIDPDAPLLRLDATDGDAFAVIMALRL